MEILLIRHGEASWEAPSDMERKLTVKGEAELAAASDYLASLDWHADEIWASPYKRAQQSARILNRKWQCPKRSRASLSPDSDINDLERSLQTFRGDRLCLVGHNPLLSNVIAHWVDDRQSYWGLQTASMALLEAELFAQGCVALKWLRHYPNYEHNGR